MEIGSAMNTYMNIQCNRTMAKSIALSKTLLHVLTCCWNLDSTLINSAFAWASNTNGYWQNISIPLYRYVREGSGGSILLKVLVTTVVVRRSYISLHITLHSYRHKDHFLSLVQWLKQKPCSSKTVEQSWQWINYSRWTSCTKQSVSSGYRRR